MDARLTTSTGNPTGPWATPSSVGSLIRPGLDLLCVCDLFPLRGLASYTRVRCGFAVLGFCVGCVVGFRVSRGVLSLVTALALVVGVAEGAGAAPSQVPPSGSRVSSAHDSLQVGADGLVSESTLSRPDWVSASVTARSANRAVEVLSQRSETRRVWVFPDGRVFEENAAGPVRFRDKSVKDGWRSIDTGLVSDSSGVHARAVPGSLALGTGANPVVRLTDQAGVAVGLGLPGVTLPSPVVAGDTATYPDVVPGVDVVVESRPAGFQLVWQVKSAAGAKGLVSRFGSAGSVVLPLSFTGVGVAPVVGSDGSVGFDTTARKAHGRLSAPVVWDAQGVGTKRNRGAATGGVFKVGKASVSGKKSTSAGSLGVDAAWLSDPARVFPVTIDPTYQSVTAYPTFDTYVKSGTTTDMSTQGDLQVGNDGAGHVARSFINWPAATFQNKIVVSSSLSLYQVATGTCASSTWQSYDAGVATTGSRWTAQPTISTARASVTDTCPGGRVSVDMTAQAQGWSSASGSQVGMMIRAADEVNPAGWRRFVSNDGSYRPVLSLLYDRVPGVPVAPIVWGATQSGGKTFVGLSTPAVTTTMPSDADVNTMRPQVGWFTSATSTSSFTSLCTSGWATAGDTRTCNTTALTDNSHGWIRTHVWDGYAWSPWSAPVEVYVALSAPQNPTISCTTAANTWAATAPSSASCTVTVSATSAGSLSAPVGVRWGVDGGPSVVAPVTQPTPSGSQQVSVAVPVTAGWHVVSVVGLSPSGKVSGTVSYGYGYVGPGLASPTDQRTTSGSVMVVAQGNPPASGTSVSGVVQWRMLGSSDTGWVGVPGSQTFTTTSTTAVSTLSGSLDTAALVGLKDASNAGPVGARTVTSVQVRACFTYSTGSKCTGAKTVVRVPHAFGSGFPTSQAGPGTVALWTGELQLSDSDATLPAANASISVSRTHETFAGDPLPAQKVFGPGWVADLSAGEDSGLSGAQVVDNTTLDGTITVLSADGDVLVFTAPSRRTGAALTAGTYAPVGDDTAESGIVVSVSSASVPVLTFTDDSGVKTVFTATGTPVAGQPVMFNATSVSDPATPGQTTYQRDGSGRVTAIVAPLPVGVSSCVPGTPSVGCRILKISYATATTATATTPGDVTGQVTKITAQVNTDPDRVLSSYTYNVDATMATQTDVVTNLTTKYAWFTAADGTFRMTGLTPAGQDPYTFTYTNNQLASVTRAVPASAGGGTAQLAAFVYNQPTSVSDFNLAQFDDYGLPRTGSTVFAVFGPDQPISGAPAANSAAWRKADVFITDAQGYTVHTGNYGAGAWQLNATVYDANDNVVQTWDDRATQQLRDGQLTDIDAASTLTTYNPDWTNTSGTVVTPAGTLVTTVTGPARWLVDAAGDLVWARPVVATSYDNGDPAKINPLSNQPYRLVTKTQASTVTQAATGWTRHDIVTTTLTSYDGTASDDSSVTGWALGQPTAVTTDMDASGTVTGADITKETVYNAQGLVVQQRQPSAAGTTASPGTRLTTYYTAGTNPVSGCGNHPEWAAMVCQVGPGSGTILPTTRTTGYTWDLQPTQTVETSGAATRTTTTSYNPQMRPTTITTTSSGLTGSVTVPALTTSYDSYGHITGTTSTAGATARTWDSWGRQLTYTNTPTGATADTATTTYNTLGQISKVSDPQTTTTYRYDGTDANGNTETRGLVTGVTVTKGTTSWTATAAYDGQAAITVEKLPGGVWRRHSYDPAGQLVSLSYSGDAINPDTGQVVADQAWFGWSQTSDAAGRTVHQWNPDGGSAYDAATGVDAVQSDKLYSYDPAGRLTQTDDTTINLDGTSSCQRRGYTFDRNGNRTTQTVATTTNACSSTTATTTSRSYDAADRPTTAGYVYDPMGRQTTIPSADTTAKTGNATISYYDTDTVATITQGTTNLTYSLDGAGRRLVTDTRINGALIDTTTRHYTDDSDNPSWSVAVAAGTTTTSGYAALTDSGLGLTLTTIGTTTTAELALADPQGSITATTTVPGSSNAQGIDSWTSYTEYGQPETTNTPDTGTGAVTIGYGWLGTYQRATIKDLGLVLMGARLYNQTTALFTTPDPIYGGNDTSYGYPNDPIRWIDTSGRRSQMFWGFDNRTVLTVDGWGNPGRRIWDYALNHEYDRTFNSPVPFPHTFGTMFKNHRNTTYYVYEIVYRIMGTDRWETWKFGITRVSPWEKRPTFQLKLCKFDTWTECRVNLVGITTGWLNGRFLEASLIYDYWRTKGGRAFCPRGQMRSCI